MEDRRGHRAGGRAPWLVLREGHEDLRCSTWTRSHDVDPIGSATRADRLLLVEVPLPWPPDIADLPPLAGVDAGPGSRVLSVVPETGRRPERLRVSDWRRRDGAPGLVGVDHVIPASELGAAARAIAGGADGGRWAAGPAPREVLVCSHGRRDRCCGRFGTLLHGAVVGRWAGVRVRRCSHTGGHRFAPTGITLPDGRAWGFLDEDLLDAVVQRTISPRALASRYRGAMSFDQWGQVVEQALLERFGWRWDEAVVTGCKVQVADDDASAAVVVAWHGPEGAGRATAEVAVARTLPVPPCGAPVEEASKSSSELRLRSLTVA